MSLGARVATLLEPGGRIATRWPRFERRAEQERLAHKIAEFAEHGGVLLAEAPTGLGKSLAYLLPAALLAAQGKRVVVATCTRSLQDQLYERDIPALLEALELPLTYAKLKGKQNYACPRLLESAEGRGAEEDELLDLLRRWASDDSEGDLDRFPAGDPEAFRRVRGRVAADVTACTGATCRRGRECFWVRARRVAAQAPLVVVNHALLAVSGEVDGLLPDFDVLVVDEAHRLEGVLLQQLETGVTHHRFEELLRLLGSARGAGSGGASRGSGVLGRLTKYISPLLEGERAASTFEALDRLSRAASACRSDAAHLFERLIPDAPRHPIYGARQRYASAEQLFGADLQPLEAALDVLHVIARTLRRFADDLAVGDAGSAGLELSAELEQLGGRFGALALDLEDVGQARQGDRVYWRTSTARGVELHGAPVSVGAHARRLVLSRPRAAILTSATLTAGDDFGFVAERLGLGESWGVPFGTTRHPSPFDLPAQMRSFVHDPGPDEAAGIARLVAGLAESGRNQLVLFTAHERLKRARERLRASLPDRTVLLAQEWDGPAGLLADRFRRERGAILLGVQSLWEGVDFPGEALEILVMAKLPFAVPDDPLVEARGERLRDQGLDPFRHDALPEAVLRFRQGVGRLIRRADDRGVLVVCDPRLRTASYAKAFLGCLPAPPRVIPDTGTLVGEALRFLAAEVVMEDPA